MSHYTVAVFTEDSSPDLDSILAQYDENIQVERYLSTTKQQAVEYERQRISDKKVEYDKYLADPEKYIQETYAGDTTCYPFKYLTEEFPQQLEWTDEQCYQNYIKDVPNENIDPETGDIYSTYNPDSKWDWWSIGGRWGCMLLVKDEDGNLVHEDEGFVRDVDFEKMREELAEDLKPYDEYMTGDTFYKKEYLKQLYPDEKTYIQQNTEFSTFAVVTPDGEWHEPGHMGWFGCSSETPEESIAWHEDYFENFIKPAIENNWYLTLIDCHI